MRARATRIACVAAPMNNPNRIAMYSRTRAPRSIALQLDSIPKKHDSRLTIQIVATSLFLWLLLLTTAPAQGPNDLLVAPPRAVFEGSTRSISISLINRGSDTGAYVITMRNYRMTEEGKLEEISQPDSGQLFADAIVRYFPRQVVLAPAEEQTLRLQLVAGNEIPDGEYRSHIYMRAIPRARAAEEEVDSMREDGISMRLTPVYGIIVPVIVRRGDVTVAVDIPKVDLDMTSSAQPILNLNINRWGTASTYGDIAVTYQPASGSPVQVGRLNGVAIYPPSASRAFHLGLTPPPGTTLSGGRLIVEYRSRSTYREVTLARAELNVP